MVALRLVAAIRIALYHSGRLVPPRNEGVLDETGAVSLSG
jgi:hypothetical protein